MNYLFEKQPDKAEKKEKKEKKSNQASMDKKSDAQNDVKAKVMDSGGGVYVYIDCSWIIMFK